MFRFRWSPLTSLDCCVCGHTTRSISRGSDGTRPVRLCGERAHIGYIYIYIHMHASIFFLEPSFDSESYLSFLLLGVIFFKHCDFSVGGSSFVCFASESLGGDGGDVFVSCSCAKLYCSGLLRALRLVRTRGAQRNDALTPWIIVLRLQLRICLFFFNCALPHCVHIPIHTYIHSSHFGPLSFIRTRP